LIAYALQDVVILEKLHLTELCIQSSTQDVHLLIGSGSRMDIAVSNAKVLNPTLAKGDTVDLRCKYGSSKVAQDQTITRVISQDFGVQKMYDYG